VQTNNNLLACYVMVTDQDAVWGGGILAWGPRSHVGTYGRQLQYSSWSVL